MLKKLVEVNHNGEKLVGFISEDKLDRYSVSVANPNFSEDDKELILSKHKDGLDLSEFQRITQYNDPDIKTATCNDILEKLDNHYKFDDIVSEYSLSGEVSAYKYKISMMKRIIGYAHANKLVLSDINSYDYENELDFFFTR